MHIPVAVIALVVMKKLPEGISFHAVPHLMRISCFVRVIPVALDDHVPKLVPLAAASLIFNLFQPTAKLGDFIVQLLLDAQALITVAGIFAHYLQRLLELLIFFSGGLVPIYQVILHFLVDKSKESGGKQKLQNIHHGNIAEQLFKLIQSCQLDTSNLPAAIAKASVFSMPHALRGNSAGGPEYPALLRSGVTSRPPDPPGSA